MFLEQALISWKSKKQGRVSKFTVKSEYPAMSVASGEILWLHGLLLSELGFPKENPTPLHTDNTSAIHITANPVYHDHTKHIDVDCHFIREAYDDDNVVSLPHVPSELQVADVFTKVFTTRQRHNFLVDKLMLTDKPASILWGMSIEYYVLHIVVN